MYNAHILEYGKKRSFRLNLKTHFPAADHEAAKSTILEGIYLPITAVIPCPIYPRSAGHRNAGQVKEETNSVRRPSVIRSKMPKESKQEKA